MKANALLLATLLVTSILLTTQTASAEISYVEIDPANRPYQITCDAPDDAYMSMYENGKIARVDKDSKSFEVIQSNDGVRTGNFFYSLDYDPMTNSIFANDERGLLWKYSIDSETWDSVPIVEEIPFSAKVIYIDGYETHPLKIAIDERPGSHGWHQYITFTKPYGMVLAHDGFVWVATSYNVDFDSQAETNAGMTDLRFSGLAKVFPDSMTVEKIAISGSTSPSAIAVDPDDSDILWIANRGPNTEIYKFDITSETVIQTIELNEDYNPRNLAVDSSYIYVPLGVPADFEKPTNSEIMRISKANPAERVIIDTLAPNTDEGSFAVHLFGNSLMWSDNSGHTGSVNLDNDGKLWRDNSAEVDNTYFGCASGDEWFWAGEGSTELGIQTVEATEFIHKVNGTVKRTDGTATKKIELTISGAYSCDSNMRIKPVAGSMKATIKDGSSSKTVTTKISVSQVDNFAIKYSINAGTFGKVSGKSTFGSEIDCHNELDESKQTKKNSMTFTKNSIVYKMLTSTDLARIVYS